MKTILLADDEPNLRLLVHATLEGDGYRILEAKDGQGALDIVMAQPVDLLILDWMMPKMTGIEVVEHVRRQPTMADIPVIMLTAKGQDHDRSRAMAAGVFAYLIKPFSPLELIDLVKQALSEGKGEG